MGTHCPVKGKGPQLGTYFVCASISAEDEALLWKAYFCSPADERMHCYALIFNNL